MNRPGRLSSAVSRAGQMRGVSVGQEHLIRSEESGGEVSVIETRPAPGVGPPLHHHDFDEAFYVLEGELTFLLRDELVTAGAGELVFAPRGISHTFANLTDAPAHQLIVCTPAGFERYFRALGRRAGRSRPA